jgi:hypothetical protein
MLINKLEEPTLILNQNTLENQTNSTMRERISQMLAVKLHRQLRNKSKQRQKQFLKHLRRGMLGQKKYTELQRKLKKPNKLQNQKKKVRKQSMKPLNLNKPKL